MGRTCTTVEVRLTLCEKIWERDCATESLLDLSMISRVSAGIPSENITCTV